MAAQQMPESVLEELQWLELPLQQVEWRPQLVGQPPLWVGQPPQWVGQEQGSLPARIPLKPM
jgi:hypothetical protein